MKFDVISEVTCCLKFNKSCKKIFTFFVAISNEALFLIQKHKPLLLQAHNKWVIWMTFQDDIIQLIEVCNWSQLERRRKEGQRERIKYKYDDTDQFTLKATTGSMISSTYLLTPLLLFSQSRKNFVIVFKWYLALLSMDKAYIEDKIQWRGGTRQLKGRRSWQKWETYIVVFEEFR